MVYKRNGVTISVERVDGFGKNPALWIGTENPNQIVKVASFGSEDKANQFCKWLEYILGDNRKKPCWETEVDESKKG